MIEPTGTEAIKYAIARFIDYAVPSATLAFLVLISAIVVGIPCLTLYAIAKLVWG